MVADTVDRPASVDSPDAGLPDPAIEAAKSPTTARVIEPPDLDPVSGRLAGPTEIPNSQCDRTITTGTSIQDAIDAVTDRVRPYVLCLDGTFDGGGALPSADRPGIGPYHGTIVLAGRRGFTLRGLPGSVIRGIATSFEAPDPSAAPPDQHPFDQTNLIKVVDSSEIVLEGLTVDGLVGGEPALNRLVWFQNVTDSALRFSVIRNAGGECVRLKSNSQRNIVHHNQIENCGVFQALRDEGHRLRKNGEGIYLGTDPAQVASSQINRQQYWGLDPSLVTDRTSFNWIHHNVIAPGRPGEAWGNECVDIKEDWPRPRPDLPTDEARGAPGNNMVSDNVCSGQFDPESGGFDSRGPNNSFEHNLVTGEILGASIRVGAKTKEVGGEDVDWRATQNRVRMNVFESHGTEYALKAWADQPLVSGDGVCGNVDAEGSPMFSNTRFVSDRDAAVNQPRCADDPSPAGPRGALGPPPR